MTYLKVAEAGADIIIDLLIIILWWYKSTATESMALALKDLVETGVDMLKVEEAIALLQRHS